MKQRGRKPKASTELSIVTAMPVERVQRLSAPHDLNDEEIEVWVMVVNSHSADWFTDSIRPLLTQYCRHTIAARRISELLEKIYSSPNATFNDVSELLQMQARESAALTSIATKLRVTNQSLLNHHGNKKRETIGTQKPWDWQKKITDQDEEETDQG